MRAIELWGGAVVTPLTDTLTVSVGAVEGIERTWPSAIKRRVIAGEDSLKNSAVSPTGSHLGKMVVEVNGQQVTARAM